MIPLIIKFRRIARTKLARSAISWTALLVAVACAPSLTEPNDLGLLSLNVQPAAAIVAPGETHTVGGSMLGLSGSLVLSLNDAQDLVISTDGDFTFPTGIASGASYVVSVKTQPTLPVEYCAVSEGTGTIAAPVVNVQVACFQLPDTGQAGCHGSGGGAISCGSFPFGQDGDFTNTPAALTHIAGGDGTVRETASFLLWQQCPMDTTWTGSNCTSGPGTTTWSSASSYCADLTLAGRTWRLPTVRELLLWPDYGLNAPALNTSFFQSTPGTSGTRFWTSTVNSQSPGRAWTVDISIGSIADLPFSSAAFVRCVSGPSMPANQFITRDNGTVHDRSTNLTWTKCSVTDFGTPTVDGTTNCSATPVDDNWDSSVDACEALIFAGRTDWRLPSARELGTLLDFSLDAPPLINMNFFPNTGATNYWTSTSNDQTDSNAWDVNFANLVIDTSPKGANFRARCVATGL